jgi:hypothetical protein
MIKELYGRFPDMVKMLLQKASETVYGEETERIKNARNRLLAQLNAFTEEMSKLSNMEGEGLTDEHIKKILETPRPLPESMKWNFKPRVGDKKVDKKVSGSQT